MKRSQPGLTRWPIAAVAASSFVMMLAGLAPGFAQQVGGKAVEIMRQSMTARGQVDYSAVAAIVRYREGERHDARQMVLRQQGDRECIKVLDGDGKLKFKRVSDGRTRWEHSVRHGRVMKMPLPPRAETLRKDLTNLEILADNFELTLEGPGTVAGRVVHRITITHPGPPRVLLRRLWIDEQNYLELKSEHYDDAGRATRSVTVERVNLQPQFDGTTFVFHLPDGLEPHEVRSSLYTGTADKAAEKAGFKAVVPARTDRPPGFLLYKDLIKVREWEGKRVLWYQFTNGMRSYSVFQRQVQPAPNEPNDRQGPRTFKARGFQFTVMGSVQPDELDKIKAGYEAP